MIRCLSLIIAVAGALAVEASRAQGVKAPAPKPPSMKTLLNDGWRISSHSTLQRWEEESYQSNNGQTLKYAKPRELITSFVLEKAKKSSLCWGNQTQGYDHSCTPLN